MSVEIILKTDDEHWRDAYVKQMKKVGQCVFQIDEDVRLPYHARVARCLTHECEAERSEADTHWECPHADET